MSPKQRKRKLKKEWSEYRMLYLQPVIFWDTDLLPISLKLDGGLEGDLGASHQVSGLICLCALLLPSA